MPAPDRAAFIANLFDVVNTRVSYKGWKALLLLSSLHPLTPPFFSPPLRSLPHTQTDHYGFQNADITKVMSLVRLFVQNSAKFIHRVLKELARKAPHGM